MQNNLKALREEQGLSQDELAARMKTTRNQLAKLESGARRLSNPWIARAATALGVDAGRLVTGASSDITLRGLIGAGGMIESDISQLYQDGTTKVRLNIALSDGLSAFEVWGDSMLPKYEAGDVVIVEDEAIDPDTALGLVVLVYLKDGRRYVKRLLRGTEFGRYSLESFNSSLIENVEVKQVGLIHVAVPRNQVIHLDQAWMKRMVPKRRKRKIVIVAAE